jgi:hypothetical protein
MIEDKLTHDERLRLECIAQANAQMGPPQSAEHIIDKASKFEKYVRDGKNREAHLIDKGV